MAQTHVCGRCAGEFDGDEAYAEHTCEATGFKPVEGQHLGEHFAKIQEMALERGEARKEEAIEGEVV